MKTTWSIRTIFISLLLFAAIAPAYATDTGNITIEALQTTNFDQGGITAGGVYNWQYFLFDITDYNYLSWITINDTVGVNGYDLSEQQFSSTFSCTLGCTDPSGGTSGIAYYDQSSGSGKNISWVFDSDLIFSLDTVQISYTNALFPASITAGGSVVGYAQTVDNPVGILSTTATHLSAINIRSGVSVRTTNHYIAEWSTTGLGLGVNLSVYKDGTIATKVKYETLSGNAIGEDAATPTTGNMEGAFFLSNGSGLRLNISLASGAYDIQTVNNTTTIPTPDMTTASITTDASSYFQNEIMTYNVIYTNPSPALFYRVKLYKDVNTYVTTIDQGDYTATQGSNTFFIDSHTPGTYHIEVQEMLTSIIRGISSDFDIVAGDTPYTYDYINATKTTYALGEQQYIYGYATAISQIKIYSGGSLIANMGTYTGNFSMSRGQTSGNYLVSMERNVGGHISTITSVSYTVGNNSSMPMSIKMLDPGTFDCGYCYAHDTSDRKFAIGNTADGSDGGQMITVQYNRKNDTDVVYIYQPDGTLFTTWNVSTYTTWLTSREFYVPNEEFSIGLWTATIIDGGNASNTSSSTLTAFIYGNMVDNGNTIGNAVITVSDSSPCSGNITGISWKTANLSTGYVAKLYKVTPFTMYVNETYMSPNGTIAFKPMTDSSEYRFVIMNSTTNQLINQATIITKSSSECAAAGGVSPAITPSIPTSAEMNTTSLNLLMVLTQIAFYGAIIYIGVIYGLLKLGVSGMPLIIISGMLATFEALIGLFGSYGIYVTILTWLIIAVYFKFGRDMTTGGD